MSSFKPVSHKESLSKIEHEILNFWEKNKIFEKSIENRRKQGAKKYVFFDGPPFANGLPHYGHILANAIKDAVTRYFTMAGYYVPRVNGWDCHGLPVEYEIEKELNISGKKNIEKMGIDKFNAACKKSVFRYTKEWEMMLKRIGRWVDFKHSYATLENSYMESIWWVFKKIWEKKMVYQGYKSIHICPRCETPLSNFEVTLGYKEVVDPSVTIKFPVKGKKNTFFLAWTTTPWTLPGNTALAVSPNIDYVKVKFEDSFYILAETRLNVYFHDKKYEIVERVRGKKLEGLKYEPLFDFYEKDLKKDKKIKSYIVVTADFVSIEEGTGIVHIAPAFGEEDYLLSQKKKLAVIAHVNSDGTFKKEVKKWHGKFVRSQDLNIKDDLQKRGLLFHFENYKHSYPHCWRCDTPLLNYSTKAWFIRVTDLKEKLLKNNQKIHWVPSHIKEGRFGKWLEGVRDWNISRNRYWGCPIPIWECVFCGFQKCIGAVQELRQNSTGGNTYFLIRHGEAEHNAKGIDNCNPKIIFHLTKKGKKQIQKIANLLKKEKIDFIFSSPFPRTKDSAKIIAEILKKDSNFDNRLREHNLGKFDGKKTGTYASKFRDFEERFIKKLEDTESFKEVEERFIDFINYIEEKYQNKKIVIVTHGDVIRAALHALASKDVSQIFKSCPDLGSMTKIYSGKLPMQNSKLDLHRPYIDKIKFKCEKCKKEMRRIPEVLDCWFESGAMPYAQLHYPFENKREFEENFPAHFIGEGLDQTRGWFYTLHVLATILFDSPAFKNVIVNGILLAADGEKLSKRKKNYPDPNKLFEAIGVDSIRMFLYSSNAPLAEDVRFSEKHVEELLKKFTLTLWNTYSFFVTYANIDKWHGKIFEAKDKYPQNKLDQWILSELNALIEKTTEAMNKYDLTAAVRPIIDFVDNLSNWYIRRSRRRFWKSENDSDKKEAYKTLYTVLIELNKLIAPFMPFTADAIFKNLSAKESVHLENLPRTVKKFINKKLNNEMQVVRKIVTLSHGIRALKNIKIRQPLSTLQIALPSSVKIGDLNEYAPVIADEVNVKTVEFIKDSSVFTKQLFRPNLALLGPKYSNAVQEIIKLAKEGKFKALANGKIEIGNHVLDKEDGEIVFEGKEGFDIASNSGIVVNLNTQITKALLEEGYIREIVRNIQEMRKSANYDVADRIYVCISTDKSLQDVVTKYADFIEKEVLAIELQEGGDFEWDAEKEINLEGLKVKLGVRKT